MQRLNYGWVIVGTGFVMTGIGMGSMMSLAVFLEPITRATEWTRTGVSMASTLNFLCMGVAAFGWGALSDRFGTRAVVLAGAVLLGLGMILASRAESLLQFQLLFGSIVGVAAGSFYAPMTACATAWIHKNRSLAVALVSAGMGMGSLTISPFARVLITAYDWRTAMLVVGCLSAILIPAAFLVRQPPADPHAVARAPGTAHPDGYTLSAAESMRTPQFIAIALTHFACCAAHSGPILHFVSNAIGCGIGPLAAAGAFGVMGLAGLGGRIFCGLVADRVGVKPTLVAGLMVQAIGASLFLFTVQLHEFYAVGILFGLAYGGVMPLYAILLRDYFGPRIMGTTFGAVSMVASLGMALGPWAGGYAFDTFNSYLWLYVGSFAAGLGAVAIAISFRPIKRPQVVLQTIEAKAA